MMDVIQSCCCCLRCPPDKDLTTPYTYLGRTEIYTDMLKECFDLRLILESDGECGICEMCVRRLRDASDFRLQVQRCQAELRTRLTEEVSVKVEPTVQSEMPDDDSTGDESMLETFDEITIEKTEIIGGNETISDEDPLLTLERLDEDRISEGKVTPDESENRTKDSVTQNGLPEKSKRSYKKTYQDFMNWKINKNDGSFSEDTLLEYFQYLCSCNQKPSTLWVVYSKLKSTILLYHREDISGYTKLQAFLKKGYNGYKGKQARTFSSDNLNSFIDDREFLLIKDTNMEEPSKKRGVWRLEQLEAAMAAVREGLMSQRAAAKRYSIPRRTLTNHIKTGKVEKQLGRRTVLTAEQENDLALRIEQIASTSLLTPKLICKQAYAFCNKNGIPNNFNHSTKRAGKKWLNLFLKRHPDISKKLNT